MWQELEEPILYKCDSEHAFIIVSEMDFENVQAGVFLGRGFKFNYENQNDVTNVGIYIVQFSVNDDAHWEEE